MLKDGLVGGRFMRWTQKLKELLRAYKTETNGQFATMFALSAMALLIAGGVAIDVSNLHNYETKSQNVADMAALASARYLADNLEQSQSELDFQKFKKEAEKVGDAAMEEFLSREEIIKSSSSYEITEEYARVQLKIQRKPLVMGMFGVKQQAINVSSTANLAHEGTKDVDIVLITDATGSMVNQLAAVQENMKDFTYDLQLELDKSNVKLGKVRVKFIFFRDYMVDNDMRWTGRRMALEPGMEETGAMYESDFFVLPADDTDMDAYVDFMGPGAGGSVEESGIEAFYHALTNGEWGSGETTVRAIVLWTDAIPRPLGDYDESYALTPEAEFPGTYFTDAYWDLHMGPTFTAMTELEREAYMYDNFYPSDEIPPTMTLADMKQEFETFHDENSNGKTGITTFSLNLISGCYGGTATSCGDWDEFSNWDGVNVIRDDNLQSSSETYDNIIQQVAQTVLSQVAARDIAIIN